MVSCMLLVLLALHVAAIAGDSAPVELGCFIDDGWDRDLNGYSVPSILITSENCVNICRENRYRYAGVQNGNHCYCGNSYGMYGEDDAPDACSTPCEGDVAQLCGGSMRNYIYDVGGSEDRDELSVLTELGCFIDTEDHDLAEFGFYSSKVTPERCVNTCRAVGFRFAGLQQGHQCYCGDTYGRYGEDDAPDACTTTCWSDETKMCGGSRRNSVYDVGGSANDGGGEDDEEVSEDCSEYGRYNCGRRNPCNPQCVEGQEHYLGSLRNMYITCGEDNSCMENTCPDGQIWYQSLGRCDFKSLWGVTAQVFTGANANARCIKNKFDCRERNPCAPERCISGQDMYPGTGRLRFVECQGSACEEVSCPRGRPFDVQRQECVSTRA